MKQKLPEITMAMWLEAEETVKQSRIMAKPAGFTADEYAKARGCTVPTARRYLLDMFHTGLATRIKWHNGNQGGVFVYQLKRNGKTP